MARARSGQEFEVEPSSNGLFDLRYNGRAVCYDRDMDEIRREVARKGSPGDSVTLIHPDGYRESLGR